MRLGDKIEVAPLDPARLARIEDGIVASGAIAAPARRPLSWRLAPAALALCGLVAAAGALGWQLRGGGAAAARTPAPVVATGDGESAALRLEGASLRLGPGTELSLRDLGGGGTRVDLARGRIDCEVAPRRNRPPFVVRAGDVDVRVVGTAYSVERQGDQVRVEVTRGRVEVVRQGAILALVAGQSWRSDEPARVAAISTEPDPGAGGASRAREAASDTVAPAPRAAPDRDAPAAMAEPDRDAPAAAVEQRDERAATAGRDRDERRAADRRDPDPRPRRRADSREPARAVALPAGLPPLAPCAADGLDACRRQGLAHGGGVDHASALYSLIHLEVERGLFDRALRHAELYEVRFQRRRPEEATAVHALRELAAGRAE